MTRSFARIKFRRRLGRQHTAPLAGAMVVALMWPMVPAAQAEPETVSETLQAAVAELPEAEEDRTGYERDLFPHWIDADRDGCNTRKEVLIAEATVPPAIGPRCTLTGGEWYSYYDDATWSEQTDLDIDHMVPLAEAWDSGASEWTTAQRRDYANDLGDERSLVAVTDNENQAKADQDPAEWMPPYEPAQCRYISEWVAVKTRWRLTVDTAERDALTEWAEECPEMTITVTYAR